jgi:hypothetical protein
MALAAVTTDISAGVGANGTLAAVSTMRGTSRNVVDDSINTTGLGFNAAAGERLVTSPQYAEVSYNDNRVGDQRIILRSDNGNGAADPGTDANPRYCPEAGKRGTGAGLIGTIDCKIDVPLFWTIHTAKVTGGYQFVNDPATGKTDTVIQAFIQDLKAELNDFDTDKNGTRDCAEADTATRKCIRFDVGYAAMIFGLAGNQGLLANFPVDSAPTVDDDGNPATRSANDGPARLDDPSPAFVYFAADYSGKDAQPYSTNTLEIQLVTVTA